MIADSKKENKEVEQQDAPNQADVAAMFFKTNIGVFKSAVGDLSGRAKTRLLKALMEYPLKPVEEKFHSNEEKALYSLGTQLTQAKIIMTLETLHSATEQMVQKGEENEGIGESTEV